MSPPTTRAQAISSSNAIAGTIFSWRKEVTDYANLKEVNRRLAEENAGWRLITTQLNHERVALMSPGPATRFVEETAAWAREARRPDGLVHLHGGR